MKVWYNYHIDSLQILPYKNCVSVLSLEELCVCIIIGRALRLYYHWKNCVSVLALKELCVLSLEVLCVCFIIGRAVCLYYHWKNYVSVLSITGAVCLYCHWKSCVSVLSLEELCVCIITGRVVCQYYHSLGSCHRQCLCKFNVLQHLQKINRLRLIIATVGFTIVLNAHNH